MPSKTLDERIDAHRALLARLLRQRIAVNLRGNYPTLRALWVYDGHGEYGPEIVRACGPGRTVLWDRDHDRGEPLRSFTLVEGGVWYAQRDLRLLAALVSGAAPRTKDGYLIVRLPEEQEACDEAR